MAEAQIEDPQYAECWRQYRANSRSRMISYGLAIGGGLALIPKWIDIFVPVVLFSVLIERLFKEYRQPTVAPAKFICPRCNDFFFGKHFKGLVFAVDECQNCGLKKYAKHG